MKIKLVVKDLLDFIKFIVLQGLFQFKGEFYLFKKYPTIQMQSFWSSFLYGVTEVRSDVGHSVESLMTKLIDGRER